MRPTTLILSTILAAFLASLAMQPWESATNPARAATTPMVAPPDALSEVAEMPVGLQLRWILDQLNGDAVILDEAALTAHFAPVFLAGLAPAPLLQLLQETAIEHGPVSVTGLAGQPTATALIALIETRNGTPAAVYLDIEATLPHRITSLEISEPPPPPASALATPGPYTGSYDIGGRRLFLTCAGEGSPTVVLEAGAGAGAAAWMTVQPTLARHTRVCSYDRANVPGGASDPAPKPRSAMAVVADLHALLAVARVPGPYVLAGHSLGGLYVRLYASIYPADVAGLVLIDAAHEDQETRLAALLQPFQSTVPPAAVAADAPFVERVGDEQVAFDTSAVQVRTARTAAALRPMPLIVLAHGVAAEPGPGTPPELVDAQERLWRELQVDLAGLVPGGQLIVAEQSGHVIQEEQPEIVVGALVAAVNAVRQVTPTVANGK